MLLLALLAVGCARPQQVSSPDGASPAPPQQQQGIMAQLEQKHPGLFKTVEVWGTNPAGTMLCFRSKQGGTYIYRTRTGQVESILHAMALGPGQITRITFTPDVGGRWGTFMLWAKENCVLSIGADE
jgi:hypothetical protein